MLQQHNEANAARRELLSPKVELAVQVKAELTNALKSEDNTTSQQDKDRQEILLENLFSESVNKKYHEVCTMISEYWCAVSDMDKLLSFYRNDNPEEYLHITQAIEMEDAYDTHEELLDQLRVFPVTVHDGMNRQVYDYRQIEAEISEKRQQAEAGISSLYDDMRAEIDHMR